MEYWTLRDFCLNYYQYYCYNVARAKKPLPLHPPVYESKDICIKLVKGSNSLDWPFKRQTRSIWPDIHSDYNARRSKPQLWINAHLHNTNVPFLRLPMELLLEILSHLEVLDSITLSLTCKSFAPNLEAPQPGPLKRKIRSLSPTQKQSLREMVLRDRYELVLDYLHRHQDQQQQHELLPCFYCCDAHSADYFFPSQRAAPNSSRECKRAALLPGPPNLLTAWTGKRGVKSLKGKTFLRRESEFPIPQGRGMLALRRFEIKRVTLAFHVSYRAHASWEYVRLRRPEGSRDTDPGDLRADMEAYAQRGSAAEEPVRLCQHVGANSPSVLDLANGMKLSKTFVANDPRRWTKRVYGRCRTCGTRFWLEHSPDWQRRWRSFPAKAGFIRDLDWGFTLHAEKNIGDLKIKDPLDNKAWLRHAVPPDDDHRVLK